MCCAVCPIYFAHAKKIGDLDIGACIFLENVPIATFNVSFESTQRKHLHRDKKVVVIRDVILLFSGC